MDNFFFSMTLYYKDWFERALTETFEILKTCLFYNYLHCTGNEQKKTVLSNALLPKYVLSVDFKIFYQNVYFLLR